MSKTDRDKALSSLSGAYAFADSATDNDRFRMMNVIANSASAIVFAILELSDAIRNTKSPEEE